MTSIALRDTAFAKHLMSLPMNKALAHFYSCLSDGPREDNLAWELWREVHGERTFTTDEIPEAIGAVLVSLVRL